MSGLSAQILEEVFSIIKDRRDNPREGSYVSSLIRGGEDAILKKVGEESAEVILAAKGGSKDDVVHEVADLIFHLMILLAYKWVEISEVFEELARRRR